MALSADRYTKKKVGDIVEYPVYTGVVIYGGGIVCIAADGYARPGAATAGFRTVGIAEGSADNTSGASGAITIRVRRDGIHLLAASGLDQSKVGDIAEISDDQTVVAAAAGANNIKVGEIVEYVSATSCWVDITRVA